MILAATFVPAIHAPRVTSIQHMMVPLPLSMIIAQSRKIRKNILCQMEMAVCATKSSQIPDSKASQAFPRACCVQKLLPGSVMSSHSRHRIILHLLIWGCSKLCKLSKLGLSSIQITCHHCLLSLRLHPQPF